METPAEPASAPISEAEYEERERAAHRRSRRTKLATMVVVILIATGGIGWATGWFSRSPDALLGIFHPTCPPTVNLNGSGSTFIAPLMAKWVGAYAGGAASRNQGCSVVQVAFNASGATSGLAALGFGGIGFVATEEPLTSAAEASLPAATLTLPLALGAVAVAYDLPGIPAGLNLTATVLAGIFLGTITEWDAPAITALNPGLSLPSGTAITVIHTGTGSSTSFVFSGFLAANNATWATEVGQGASVAWPTGVAANGDAGVASLLATTPGGIAYVGLASAQARGLTCARIENPKGVFVAPSPTTIYAAALAYGKTLPLGNQSWQNVSLLDEPGNDSYPITTFTYAIVYADLGYAYHGNLTKNEADWLAAYLYWMSVAGQVYGASLGYAPLSSSMTSGNIQIVELLKYDGLPALGDIDYDGD